jgi:hypothetical protein
MLDDAWTFQEPAPCSRSQSACASPMGTVELLAERAWQPEAREHAAVAKPGDGGDAVTHELAFALRVGQRRAAQTRASVEHLVPA